MNSITGTRLIRLGLWQGRYSHRVLLITKNESYGDPERRKYDQVHITLKSMLPKGTTIETRKHYQSVDFRINIQNITELDVKTMVETLNFLYP